jgi:MerR family copper efflux transcriptional regulator
MAMAVVTVGKAAELTGLSPKAIRLYEAKGLLPEAERTEAGYRLFSAPDLQVLRFVRQAKALGLTLGEIKDILDLQRGGAQPCTRVTRLLDAHVAEIDRTMADLRELRRSLAAARRTAEETRRRGEGAVICRIIETGAPEQADAASNRRPAP